MLNLKPKIVNLILLFCLIFPNYILAQQKSYETRQISSTPPHIDGILSENTWNDIEWEDNFTQVYPYEQKEPSQQTKFKILYDNDNLYVAIKALDSAPDSIEKRMSRRDEFSGDLVEIIFDSYHDKLTAFSFSVSAAGVKGDEAVTNNGNWDSNWDPIWYVKTSIDNEGWVAEMRIPLTQLRFGKNDEYVWGLQVNRYIFRKDERSSWKFISPTASGYVHNFGELTGIKNIIPKKQKDLTPYAVAKYESYQRQSSNPFADGRDFSPSVGLDGKIGITNNLTLDFTLNPDFGQVEADPSEVNLTTFETYFSEKRAFFIEGKNILSHQVLMGDSELSQDNLFYSRRIGRRPTQYPDFEPDSGEYAKIPDNTTILGAFKLTGKTPKGLSIGIMESLTQEENANIDDAGERREQIVEPLTNYFVARVEKDLNQSNTQLGGMITSTNRNLSTESLRGNMINDAYTGGINFRHHWKDKTYYVDFNAVFSQVNGSKEAITRLQTSSPHYFQRPDAKNLSVDSNRTSLEGFGGTLAAGKNGNGKFSFITWLTWRSPGLNLNDVGFMRRNDEIMEVVWVGFNQTEPFLFFRNANINVNQWVGLTYDLGHRYHGGNINGHVQYKNYWCTGFGISRDGNSISTETLRGGPALVYDGYTNYWGHVGTDTRKKVRFVAMYSGGWRDYRTAKSRNYALSAELQISDAFRLSMEPSYSTNYDEIAYVGTVDIDSIDSERYIRGTLNQKTTAMTFRFTYNLSPDFTIQFYAMPFISAGKYDDFKYISNPKAEEYKDRYISYGDEFVRNEITEDENLYFADEDKDENDDYSFGNPNFNVMDFNSNFVLRWEYQPGSSLYLVWSQNRNKHKNIGTYSFTDDSGDLIRKTYPYDVFLIKFSYRFGL
ncbi:MAG: carbohydrate binding family 9 domain-containing protein [Bacteroidales bacterium]|nr:carbohydrate binding family 9 domain-containing protein [Bacteroidales bacterium]MBN2820736.1 carbohydrate binding family 9 domain-containing protein [Bacteroidales bacterium]